MMKEVYIKLVDGTEKNLMADLEITNDAVKIITADGSSYLVVALRSLMNFLYIVAPDPSAVIIFTASFVISKSAIKFFSVPSTSFI